MSTADQSRRLSAIMFSDIIGYTAMMQQDESKGMAATTRYRLLLTKLVKKYGGDIVQHYGDGSLTLFPSSVSAVKCARDIQLELGNDKSISVRIGVHLGDIVVQGSDIFGDGVNIASRVESMGVAQSVLMTRRVVEDLRSHHDLETQYLGHFAFKNVERPMGVYALAVEGLTVPRRKALSGKLTQRSVLKKVMASPWFWITMASIGIAISYLVKMKQERAFIDGDAPIKIAVLPFRSLSDDPSLQYFSDGMAEMLRNYLSRTLKFTITSMTSVEQYRESSKKASDIASELDVQYLLEGSVFRDSAQVRVSAQLIDGKTDTHFWVRDYDKAFVNLLQIQQELARDITTSLKIELNLSSGDHIDASVSHDPEALDHYLLGIHHLTQYTKEANEISIQHLKAALSVDSSFLVARAALAQAYFARHRRYGQSANWIDSAINLAEKVVHQDPELPEGHFALSLGYAAKGWREQSLDHLLRTVERDPNHGPAVGNIGVQYYRRGLLDEAIRWYKKSLAINPSSYAVRSNLGSAYGYLGDYDHAEEWFEEAQRINTAAGQAVIGKMHLFLAQGEEAKALEMKPGLLELAKSNPAYYEYVGELHRMLGDWNVAERYFQLALDSSEALLNDAYSISALGLGFLHDQHGNTQASQQLLDQSLAAKTQFVDHGGTDKWVYADLAYIAAVKDDEDQFIHWMQRAIDAGWRDVQYASRDPYLEKIQDLVKVGELFKSVQQEIEKMRFNVRLEEELILN